MHIKVVFTMAFSQKYHFSDSRYILGPPNLKDEGNFGKIPRVYVNTETETEDCLLLVYRALSAAVCIVLDGNVLLSCTMCIKYVGQKGMGL